MRLQVWVTVSIVLLFIVATAESKRGKRPRKRKPIAWDDVQMRTDEGKQTRKQLKEALKKSAVLPDTPFWNIYQQFNQTVERRRARKKNKALRKIKNGGIIGSCIDHCVLNLGGKAIKPVKLKPSIGSEKALVPKVDIAFMWKVKDKITVKRNSLVEIRKYSKSHRVGAFERGVGLLSVYSGKFAAPKSGFYTFFVTIHLKLMVPENGKATDDENSYTLLLCLFSRCQEHTNAKTTSSFGTDYQATASLSSMLYLEEAMFVSVYIANDSQYAIRVLEDSQFSGYLTAVKDSA